MRPEEIPDAFEKARGDERPGEPLYPATEEGETPTNSGNHPVTIGHTIVVYVEAGNDLAEGLLDVFALDDGDLIAVPEGVHPKDADEVFRVGSYFRELVVGAAYSDPKYDDGVIRTTRKVTRTSVVATVREVRTLGGDASWKPKRRGSGV